MRLCFHSVLAVGVIAQALNAADSGRVVRSVVRADASGRLVRSTVVAPLVVRENVIPAKPVGIAAPAAEASASAPASTFREAVDQIAERNKLSPQLVHSVIRVESNYNPYAVSVKGAQGLMQLVPATARRFGVNNAFNPVENVEGGARYLRYLLDLYKGDYRLALAAYNAGEGAVAKHGGVPPYPETVNYIHQVGQRLVEARQQQKKAGIKPEVKGPEVKAPEVKAEVKPEPPDHNPIREIVEPDGKVRYVSK